MRQLVQLVMQVMRFEGDCERPQATIRRGNMKIKVVEVKDPEELSIEELTARMFGFENYGGKNED